ncbi:MAG: SDR family oxidoreductase [Pseudomonadota bacterium]
MNLENKIIVVTGAASGIGAGLVRRFSADKPKLIVCADIDEAGAKSIADEVGGVAIAANVGSDSGVKALIDAVEDVHGPIDLFCSNAGILIPGGPETSDDDWRLIMDVNVMSHIWAARHLAPKMIARGGGYFLNTASAAGLLSQVGSMPYSVTKHAAVAVAEWLAFTYGDQGIKVSVLCPQAVRSKMTEGHEDGVASMDGMLEPSEAAEACVRTIEAETFLVLPHPEVLGYFRNKGADYDRWIGGMRKLNRRFGDG